MKKLDYAYCNTCEDLVEFDIYEETITDVYKGEEVQFPFHVGRCRYCGEEVAADQGYNARRSEAKISAYKKVKHIIDNDEISEIMRKYDIGKESLADTAGFGKVTVKRYFEGFIPSKEYSDILYRILDDEQYFIEMVNSNKSKLKEVTLRKIMKRYAQLMELQTSKTSQVVNYILTHLEEVTPLALQKLLAFSQGVNYAVNGSRLLEKDSQAWIHGPVYPNIYNQYKKYGYKPIDSGIFSSHGCTESLLSKEEKIVIDMVLQTFGLYSPKTLEVISHTQTPWLEKRVGYGADEAGQNTIDEESVKKYYTDRQLNTRENILKYINSIFDN